MSQEVHVRWAIQDDFDAVMAIERQSFEFPWSEADMMRCLRNQSVVAMVAEVDEVVVGYIIYELNKTYYWLMNIAVHPDWRHLSIGSQLLTKLKGKLSFQRRSTIRCLIREKNLAAHLWLAANGFKATGISRSQFVDTDEDALRFTYRIHDGATVEGVARSIHGGTPSTL